MSRIDSLTALQEHHRAHGKDMLLSDFLEYDYGDFDETACALNALNMHSRELCAVLIDALIARTARPDRISRIIDRLTSASELTLHRIETELGLTPRPEGHDAGQPYRFDEHAGFGENNGPIGGR